MPFNVILKFQESTCQKHITSKSYKIQLRCFWTFSGGYPPQADTGVMPILWSDPCTGVLPNFYICHVM